MAALLVPIPGGMSSGSTRGVPPRFDLRARSRESLRRGLLLSGAIHVAVVFAILHLQGTSDVLIRTNSHPVEVFTIQSTRMLPLPPEVARTAPSSTTDQGVFDPVRLPPPEIQSDFDLRGIVATGPTGPGPERGPITDGSRIPPNPPVDETIYQAGKVDTPPVAIVDPKPPYPDLAREYGITGKVLAYVLVKPDGTVAQVQIRSGNRILSDSVEQTLARWRFRPGMMRGQPVSVWVEIPVVFTL